jgi:3-phenylpropionate/trans-cinnamate dioxygenase ferredoxin reductase component
MTGPRSVVVVGSSLAGATTAQELRRLGFTGELHLVGDEPGCNRPPLSKQGLRGEPDEHDLALPGGRPDVHEHHHRAVHLDPLQRRVHLASGSALSYDAVVVATGARARRLAVTGQSGELVLRTADDAARLRDRLDSAQTVIVVGAGFLGTEVVSACVARGLRATLVDVDPPLLRLLGPYLAAHAGNMLRQAGVDVRTSTVRLVGDPVGGVQLSDGTVLVADVVVTCAGDQPVTGWLAGTGLDGPQGVLVDDLGRTAVPGVFAAGDVTRFTTAAGTVRRPFWSNAVAQGRAAAYGVLGLPAPGSATDDYFWSEVLGDPVKVVGDLPLLDTPEVVEGALGSGAVLRWQGQRGSAVVAWGLRRPVRRLRELAEQRAGAR